MTIRKKRKLLQHRLIKVVVGALPILLAGAPVSAQDQEGESTIFDLSPFVVSESENVGYLANSTLAGTRIRTNLGDVATSIQVVTKEFMDDTGSTNLRDLLVYTTGTEVSGVGGNFSNYIEASPGFGGNFVDRPGSQTRVRGLAGADNTRNFFPTVVGFDSYNSERVEINRGANAALFGLGSPAGIINYSTIRPELTKRFGSARFQFGSFGSNRVSADYNVPLLADQLAIRIAGVSDNEKFLQEFKYSDTDRVFVTGVYAPKFLKNKGILTSTVLRASYEKGESDANDPRTIVPQDGVTPYFLQGKPSWNPGVNSLIGANRQISGHADVFNLVSIYPDAHSTTPGQGLVALIQPHRPPAIDGSGNLFATWGVPVGWPTALPDGTPYAGDLANSTGINPFWRRPSISDPNVFDFYKQTFEGPNKHSFNDFDAVNASLEMRFFNNKLGFELAYDRQTSENGRTTFGDQSGLGTMAVDYNTHLHGGEVNPNYGRPAFHATSNSIYNETELETKRLTAYYRFDFRDLSDASLMNWLGSIDFTGLYTKQTSDRFDMNGFTYTYADDGQYGSLQGNGRNRVDSGVWDRPVQVWYLGDSVANFYDISQVHLEGVNVIRRPELDGATNFIGWDNSLNQWVKRDVGLVRQDPGPDMPWARVANKNLNEIESKVLVMQNKFLKDHLVSTLSWRNDKTKLFSNSNAPRGSRFERLYKDPSFVYPESPELEADQDTFTWGAVGYVPEFIVNKIPGVSRLSVFYNSSENFQPSGLRQDPYGNPIAPPSGTTKDYGFRANLLDDKIVLGVTWYETSQVDVSAGLGLVATAVARLEGRVLSRLGERGNVLDVNTLDSSVTTPGLTQAQLDAQISDFLSNPWPEADRWLFENGDGTFSFTTPSGTNDTYDLTSKGVEVEVTMNLRSNWRLTFNVAKQDAKQSNTGTTTLDFVNDRIDLYNRVPDLPATETFGENVKTSVSGNILSQYYLVANKDNNIRPEVNKWRVNVITNYIFEDGPLQGFSVGAAYRYQSGAGVGYPTFWDSTLNIYRIDATKPYIGPSVDNIDMWVGYRTNILNDKVVWSTQLNIRNIFNDDDLIPTYANPDGRIASWRIPSGRTLELRTGFEF